MVEVDGEFIVYVYPEIGYLHRGTEKLCEYNEYYKITPFFDRFDYVGLLICEHSYVLAIETLLDEIQQKSSVSVNNAVITTRYLKTQVIRCIYNNLVHISSHLLALTTSAMDIGALTPFLFAFEEREEIACILERISGARMHTAFYSINGLNFVFTKKDLNLIKNFLFNFNTTLVQMFEMLSYSKIWFQRFKDVGVLTQNGAISHGVTGPLIRSTGLNLDLRVTQPYETYKYIPFMAISSYNGDNLDRFFIRVEEIMICTQYLEYLLNFYEKNFNLLTQFSSHKSTFTTYSSEASMEELIRDFKSNMEGYLITNNKTYLNIESPRGYFGVHCVSSKRSINRP
jgi:NADH:ubiquinone oxidoreductase subunit D